MDTNASMEDSAGLMVVLQDDDDLASYRYEDLHANGTSTTLEDSLPYIMMVFAVIEYLLIAAMIFGNAFILTAYISGRIRNSRSSSRLSPSGRLVLNLSFADLLVGLGLCYFSVFKFWPELAARLVHHRVPCILRFSMIFLTMFGSHCALMIIALDRYTAIVHTLHYKDYVTTRLSWCLIAAGWTIPVVGGGLVFYANEWRPDVPSCDEYYIVPNFLLVFAMPSNVVVLVCVSWTHWRVHREVKAYNERCANADFVASAAHRYRQGRGSRKSANVLLQVTGTFIFCWTPFDVMLVTFVIVGPGPVVVLLFEMAFTLSMTSFLINPFIYAWKTEAVRKPLLSFLARLGVRQTTSDDTSDGLRRPAVFAIGPIQSFENMSSSASGSASSTGTGTTTCNPI